MKKLIALVLLCYMFGVAAFPARAQSSMEWTFDLIPSTGEVYGQAGSAVGWGYRIRNLSSDKWLVGESITPTVGLQHGTYTVLFDQPALAPNSTLETTYNGFSGIGSLGWDTDASTGFVNTGTFRAEFSWYDSNPYDPNQPGNLISSAGTQEHYYSAMVSAASTVPEPSALALVATGGISGLGWLVLRQRRIRKLAS